ncbi:hypothetical protein [Paraburkholderia sp. BR14262]|uniref:hypothetical protein n=1 Tax=unclassified Paraburkholderia TaxID=2615204 RepID=UPI0034CDCBDD
MTAAIAALDETNAIESSARVELEARVRAVATRIGYQLPGDATDPDLIQRDVAANMRRSVEACLEVGRGLIMLKEVCGHGNFTARLEVLGVDDGVARKFMRAAEKFSKRSSTTVLTKALGSQTALFEMLVLDDEQIDELATTGETGALKLDDVASMSVKELRAAVRETRKNLESKNDVIASIQARNLELHEQLAGATPSFIEQKALEDLDKEALRAAEQITTALRGRIARALDQVGEGEGGTNRQLIEQAVAAALGRVLSAARDLVDEYAVSPQLPDNVGTDTLPASAAWQAVASERAAQKPANRKHSKQTA